MKRIFLFILLFIIGVGAVIGIKVIEKKVNKDSAHESQNSVTAVNEISADDVKCTNIEQTNDFTKFKDYPLLEYYFLDNNKWSLIIKYMNNGDKCYKVINENALLENIKEYLYIKTFPAGKGTSADGYIYLYKNNELIKKIPFFSVECEGVYESELDKMKDFSQEELKNFDIPDDFY